MFEQIPFADAVMMKVTNSSIFLHLHNEFSDAVIIIMCIHLEG
jgi:hypothetical protein